MPISVAGSGPGELPPYYKGPDTKVLDFLRYYFLELYIELFLDY